MGLINAFPQYKKPTARRVELCRFTSSGTFDPAQYPTEDGLYDVYIVGGGGGSAITANANIGEQYGSGGGGGYAAIIRDLELTAPVAVTIGTAGVNGKPSSSGTDGGATKFGAYKTVNGGKKASDNTGGDGGCGGAGPGGSFGGIDGNNGSHGRLLINGVSNSLAKVGTGGTGGGNAQYCPTNPYDNKQYGIGGNAMYMIKGHDNQAVLTFPPLNNNAGRGGTCHSDDKPLPGICIIYGRPLGGEI